MTLSLEYYKIFYYVALLGSFTQAAEKLCVSQPAVSQAVRVLEENLGSALFVRKARGVKLTQEGKVLYSYVKRGYESILLGESVFRRMIDLENGEIRIGASDMTLQYYLLPYLEIFHGKYPAIKVTVTNAPTPETLSNLREGVIDFGVISGPVSGCTDMELTPVRSVRDVLVAGKEFERLKGKKHSFWILEELPVICLESNTSTRKYLDSFLSANGVTLNPEFELATSDSIVQFALRNLGIGAVADCFAQRYLSSGELFELEFTQRIPQRYFCIAVSKRNPQSRAAKELLEMLVQKAE